jgi:hypothetical protein
VEGVSGQNQKVEITVRERGSPLEGIWKVKGYSVQIKEKCWIKISKVAKKKRAKILKFGVKISG